MFNLDSQFKPAGDQFQAIRALSKGLEEKVSHQVLLGITGSGKTFTIAKVLERARRPALVIAPNKTLAAQLAQEFRAFFPKNAVEYFVSYYDYYQPEAYIASTDTYIEKETQINDEIERLRHSATASLLTRKDVIVVASVSCIYGLGSPEYYLRQSLTFRKGETLNRDKLLKRAVEIQYQRSDVLSRGKFRMIGEIFEIMSPSGDLVTRMEMREGVIEHIYEYDFLTKEKLGEPDQCVIFPAGHFVVPGNVMESVLDEIKKEAEKCEKKFLKNGQYIEAQRLRQRTRQDLEMMREVGYCNGIENYSRYFTGRAPDEPSYTLLDYFPDDFVTVIDESHVTLPQLRGMYNGDRARKENLVKHGFRLPSALDNRPLRFDEFCQKTGQTIFVSATPGDYEKEKANSHIVEQIIRPTGLLDPILLVRPTRDQIKDVFLEIQDVVKRKNRVLITTLTQRMAEDLADYLKENKIKSEYLHAGVDTLDRIKILENLRKGRFDVLVGVNLLREGLDLPEVELVAILDADKEGFLRSETSLIQTIGRAARNLLGRVILYADEVTGSMERAIKETERRRKLQEEYNKEHQITPRGIKKKIASIVDHELNPEAVCAIPQFSSLKQLTTHIRAKEKEMRQWAKALEFEKAVLARDEIFNLRKLEKQMRESET